jgi:hypothetical protein
VDGLSCESTDSKTWAGARATNGIKSGKYYYEATIQGTGICRLGWSTMAAHLELGKDSHGFGYGGTGKKSISNTYEDYGGTYGDKDTMGCYLDLENKTISYSKNGRHLGIAFHIPESMKGSVLFPSIVFKGAGAVLNFGGTLPFKSFHQDDIYKNYLSLMEGSIVDIVEGSSKEVHIYTYIYIYIYICLKINKKLCICVYMYSYMFKYIHIHICIYIYIYIGFSN